jgi:hypothetical protein
MLYGPGVKDNTITDEGYSNIEYIAQRVFRLIEQRAIPEPPSHLFEWDEEQDMIDMTGLQDIRLTS